MSAYEKFFAPAPNGAVFKMFVETVHRLKHRTPTLLCKCLPTQWGFYKKAGRRRQNLLLLVFF
jgi:hypothetical protein